MATKYCSTNTCDALFAYIYTANGSMKTVILTSCAVVPTIANCCSASTDYCLALSTNPAYMTTGYYTIANDGVNRKCTISACSCDTVNWTGIASYVALIDDSSTIRYMTTCTTQALTSGNKVNIGSWSITINQPT
jgi:hypothetical protein